MKTLVKGRYVVGWDEAAGSHVIYEGGQVVYEGNRVLFAGKTYDGEVDRTVDATDCLVSPGFINAHCEITLSIAPHFYDQDRGEGYFRPKSWLVDPEQRPVFTPEEIKAGAEAMFYMLARSGSTTFCGISNMVFKRWDDPEWEPAVYVDAAMKYGLRAYLSHHFRDGARFIPDEPGDEVMWDAEKGLRGLERNVNFVKKYHGSHGDMIRGLLFPYTLDDCSPELLRATRQAAKELGVGIRMHFAQSHYEVDQIRKRHNMTPVEYVDSLGFLGPDILLTHALYIAGNDGTPYPDGRELRRLAETNTNVGNCPWVYLRRGGYLNAFGRYQREGINLVLGTDTHPDDIIQEMRWAMIMGKAAEQSSDSVTAADVYNAVTVNAAKWLGRTDIGRLAPGAKADIVMVSLEQPRFNCLVDPIQSLVYFGSAEHVKAVVIDGKPVVEDFAVVGVDPTEVWRRGQAVTEKVRQTFLDWDRQQRPADVRFPPSFPIR